jgi:hypothetical protein
MEWKCECIAVVKLGRAPDSAYASRGRVLRYSPVGLPLRPLTHIAAKRRIL